MMRLFLAAGLAAMLAPALPAQELTPAERQRIDSVFAPFDGTSRPGCAVGVARQGTTVYERGFGMADLQHGLAIDPQSIFHVASVSKQFAAIAVALLAEDGKLSLDDPVKKHIPELPDYGKPLTVRHLIYHTSGIRDHWELLGLAGWRYPMDLFTQNDVLEIVIRQKRLNFDPGDQYLYSNAGYALLAMIVERVSGQTLRRFSDERMFRPLGMHHTHVHDDHSMIVPHRTSAYRRAADGWHISIPQFDTHGATSLFSTVGDLLTWEHNFVTGTVGSRALLREAETSALLNSGRPANYGFGISVEEYRGTPARGHGGADAGYRADVVRFPDHGLAISVLCNFAEATPNTYSRAIADILLEGKLGPRPAQPTDAGVSLTDAELDRVAGIYRTPGTDQSWRFEQQEGKLRLANFGMTLAALGPRRFTAGGIVAEFAGPPDQPATGAMLYFGTQVFDSMQRVPAYRPSRAQLEAFAGEYWSDELGLGYTVALEGDTLVLRRPKHGRGVMTPVFEPAFAAAGTGTIRFVMERGRVTGFRVTGGRVRNVEFVRAGPRGGTARP